MGKGLPRSLKRGPRARQKVVKQRVDLTGKTITVSATGAAVGLGNTTLYSFPEGNVLFIGFAGTIGFAGSGSDANLTDTWSGDFALGTTADADGTLSGSEADILGSTALGPAVAEAIATARFAESVNLAVDNTANDVDLLMNLVIDAANIVDDESVVITLSGEITLFYTVLGDD